MFYLIVQMSAEPIVEQRMFNIAGGDQLHAEPAQVSVVIDVHGQVVHLRYPNKPMTLDKSSNIAIRVG